jgi:hypothetical protein
MLRSGCESYATMYRVVRGSSDMVSELSLNLNTLLISSEKLYREVFAMETVRFELLRMRNVSIAVSS